MKLGDQTQIPAVGASRVQRVRHELKRRTLRVRRVETLSPHVRSVTLCGDDLADFVSLSFDDHIKILLPGADGAPAVARDYTPRHFDRAALELTIEFALHGDGPAAAWASQAKVGQQIGIGGPRGSFIVPKDLDWHLLVGDATALPAIARRLGELPAGAKVRAIVQMPDVDDRRALVSAADLELQWVSDAEQCLAAVRAWQHPAGEGFAWCAGEAASMATLRRLLVQELGIDRHSVRAAAYWKRDAVAFHENLSD